MDERVAKEAGEEGSRGKRKVTKTEEHGEGRAIGCKPRQGGGDRGRQCMFVTRADGRNARRVVVDLLEELASSGVVLSEGKSRQ